MKVVILIITLASWLREKQRKDRKETKKKSLSSLFF